jgi:putative ABC transport system permease protein
VNVLALCRLLVALGGAIVPSALRDEWTREWHAELWHQRERLARGHAELDGGLSLSARMDLLMRSAGAVVHAIWLRKEEWSLSMILQDARYAVRSLRHHPSFTVIAVLTLALGIGANAAVFSVVYGVLLKPLPYQEPDRLVQIWETNPLRNWTSETVAPANLLDWRARNRSFDGIAYYVGADGKGPGTIDATLTGGGEPERIRGMSVSSNFFSVLGSTAAYGRTFRADEELQGRTGVLVLSDGFWRRRFGGDPSVVGRRIDVDGGTCEVLGVMPPGFHVPGAQVDFWAPQLFDEAQFRQIRRPHWLRVIARLAPGVSIPQAREDMTRIARELEREYPATNTQMGIGLGPLHEWFVGDTRRPLLALMAAVSLVLLIACTNVAGLLLARATSRRRELAIRVALGAGRLRLLRQLLTESLLLAAAGATLGVLLAYAALDWLQRTGPANVPRLDQTRIDGWVLLFVAGTAFLTALVFGLAPAWESARSTPPDRLQEGGRSATSGGVAVRRTLVGAEVALSVVLLVGAGLLVTSFLNLRAVNPGIATSGALSFRMSLPSQRYDNDAKVATFYSDVVARLKSVPGVSAAGATARLALEGYNWTGDLFIDGKPDVWGRELRHKAVTPGYFEAAGLRIIEGRDFGSQDTADGQPTVIVNHTLARLYFGDTSAVGQRLAFGRPSPTTTWQTIVAVVTDEKQDDLSVGVKPEVYGPHTQDTQHTMSVIVRTAGDPLSLLTAVRREVAAVDGEIALYDVRTLDQVVERSLAEERFATFVLSAFAGAALLLTVIGLYGIIAFVVTERTREIGVRLALGATGSNVLRMIVWDGLRVVLAGLALGLIAALTLNRAVESFLFETPPSDPVVLASVVGILAAAGILASYLPARRAARVDPAISLRSD